MPASRSRQKKRQRGARAPRTYSHPIPDPAELIEALEREGVPMPFEALSAAFGVEDEKALAALQRRLSRLVSSGRLLRNRAGEFCLLAKLDAVSGRVSAHRDGFGFLIPDEGGDDVYLPFEEMRTLLDGDRVAVRVSGSGRGGRRAGTLVEILERGRASLVGRYRREHGIGYVVAMDGGDHRFVIPDHQRHGARDGQLVRIEITEYPGRRREAQGKITQIFGEFVDPGVATDIAIESFGLRSEFPAAVSRAAEALGDRVRPADKQGREDLRELPLVTIDGADARDFDDAVYAEPAGDGWRVLVAIADVSHYVQPGDAIDAEAVLRGTSTYFPDRVVPMLPENLSNGLCSLNPQVDRLCMVCDMRIGRDGKVARSRFYRAVMRSHARLTYSEVDDWRSGTTRGGKAAKVATPLGHLYDVYRALHAARKRRGALDLDLPEVRIEMADGGRIADIAPRERNDAHRLIEECMIAANVEAARLLRRSRLPTLFRVHPGPEDDRFETLRQMMQELGIKVPESAQSNPGQMNKVLAQLRERPDWHVLAMSVLRSLAKAVYQPQLTGHFGLALSHYAHFTSPIRRYPDLLVHRGLGHIIDGLKPGKFGYANADMERLGKSTSEQERRAEQAARDVEARFKCAWMLDRVGEELDGVVTGITHFGLFVTLDRLFVEGLVHVSALRGDYYHVEHGGLRLTGERTGTRYRLGDPLKVRILRVDVDEAKLDLALADDEEAAPRAARRGRGRGRRRK